MARHSPRQPGTASRKGRRDAALSNRPENNVELAPETLIPDSEPMTPQADVVDDDERQLLIARRAYHLAEQRGFSPGAELDDWLAAEREVDARKIQARPEDQFTG